jgi:hypothetical protein
MHKEPLQKTINGQQDITISSRDWVNILAVATNAIGMMWRGSASLAPPPSALPDSIYGELATWATIYGEGSYNELDGDGSHQATEHDDTDRFNTCSPNGVLVNAWSYSHPGRGKHHA